jgi:hypothetical protein
MKNFILTTCPFFGVHYIPTLNNFRIMSYFNVKKRKSEIVILCVLFSFLSIKVSAQLTYVSCNSSCPNTLVGHVTFANKTGTTTGRWTVNNLMYGGLTKENFALTDTVAYIFTNGNLLPSTSGSGTGGVYTIVSNPDSVNGPTGLALATDTPTTTNGGIFLFRPNNANPFAVYTISGLQVSGKYCVRVKMSNATAHENCYGDLYTIVQFRSLGGANISGGGVLGGMWTRVSSYTPACSSTSSGVWNGNNQSYGIQYDEDESWYECNFQLGENPNNAKDNGFSLYFTAAYYDSYNVWGIKEIEVYGCIKQQLTSSNGDSVCVGAPTTLTAQGIGSVTDNYAWQYSTDSGLTWTPISSTADSIIINPTVTTLYSATCARTSLTATEMIYPTNSWIGVVSDAWENPANWSCGTLPDINTNVVIDSGTVVLNSNQTIRSFTLNPNASFTINSPYILAVTH